MSSSFFKGTLIVAVAAAFAGCISETPAPDLVVSESYDLSATVRGADGAPLPNTTFDYTLDLTAFGGDHFGYYVSGLTTDAEGRWSGSKNDLFFTDDEGYRCGNFCVKWENFSCAVFARDCWNDDTAIIPSVLRVDLSQMSTSYGFDTASQGYRYYDGAKVRAEQIQSPHRLIREDAVETDLKFTAPYGLMATGQTTTDTGAQIRLNLHRAFRPVIVTDLTLLTADEKESLMVYRETSQLPDESFKVSAETVGSAVAEGSAAAN